ncbi:MAG: hypothetical protein HYU36_08020 [Planctomycetes bacterium]|nr:hypothetical protein [Planctomycetota bacterium]
MSWIEPFFPYHDWRGQVWFDLLGIGFLCVFWDTRKLFSVRNLDLLVLCSWIPLGEYEKGPLAVTTLLGYLPLLYLWPRLLWMLLRPPPPPPRPNLHDRALHVLSFVLLAYSIGLTLSAPFPFGRVGQTRWCLSESSIVGVLGADQFLQCRPPYGHLAASQERPKTIYAIYGPSYFLSFVPGVLAAGVGRPFTDWAAAARWTTIALLLVSFFGLRRLGHRLGGPRAAATLGFAWSVLPYLHSASYWSWTGNLLPAAFTILVLLASATREGAALGLSVANATAASYYPAAWLALWPLGLPRREKLEFWIYASCLLLLFFGLAVAQPHGMARFWSQVSTYLIPGRMPEWRYQWSPYTYHPWMHALRYAALVAFLPVVLWTGWRLFSRSAAPSLQTLAASSALLEIHAQLFKIHAPGRMTLWSLPFLLVLLIPCGPDPEAGSEGLGDPLEETPPAARPDLEPR